MEALMTTTSFGGELISFKLDGIEKIHQGENSRDDNGKIYWKRHSPVLFPIVGKLKRNQTIINGRTFEIPQHGFARDMEFEKIDENTYLLNGSIPIYDVNKLLDAKIPEGDYDTLSRLFTRQTRKNTSRRIKTNYRHRNCNI